MITIEKYELKTYYENEKSTDMSNACAGHIQEAAADIQHNEDCQTDLNQSLFSIESSLIKRINN